MLQVLIVLQLFRDFTVWIQSSAFVSITVILWLYFSVRRHLESLTYTPPNPDLPRPARTDRVIRTETGDYLRRSLLASLTVRFARYINDDGLLMATALDPRFRALGWFDSDRVKRVEAALFKLEEDMLTATAIQTAAAVQKAAAGPVAAAPAMRASAAAAPASSSSSAAAAAAAPVVASVSHLQLFLPPTNDRLKRRGPAPRVSEVKRYFEDGDLCPELKVSASAAAADILGTAALDWWKQYGANIPFLASMARTYMCVPATSAEPERVWSAAALLCAPLRGRLSEDAIEEHIFLHENPDLVDSL